MKRYAIRLVASKLILRIVRIVSKTHCYLIIETSYLNSDLKISLSLTSRGYIIHLILVFIKSYLILLSHLVSIVFYFLVKRLCFLVWVEIYELFLLKLKIERRSLRDTINLISENLTYWLWRNESIRFKVISNIGCDTVNKLDWNLIALES